VKNSKDQTKVDSSAFQHHKGLWFKFRGTHNPEPSPESCR